MSKRPKKAKKVFAYTLLMVGVGLSVCMLVGQLVTAWSGWLPSEAHPRAAMLPFVFPVFLVGNVVLLIMWLVVRWRYACIPAVALLLTLPTVRAFCPINWPTKAPAESVEIMTYNVFNMHRPEGVNMADCEITNFMLHCGADIICCQEAGGLDASYMDSLFQEVYPYRSYNVKMHRGDILACYSKYPILSEDTVFIAADRTPSMVYHIAIGKDTLLLINSHLESYRLLDTDKAEYKEMLTDPSDNAVRKGYHTLVPKVMEATRKRGPQAERLADFVAQSDAKYIVCVGDMNDIPMSYAHYRLTRVLNDAFTRSGNGLGWSYNRSGMYFRIDHIFTSSAVKAYQAKVDRSCKGSDHYPLRCRISLR